MRGERKKAIEGIKTGDRFTLERVFSLSESQSFAGLTGDENPVHSSDAFARAKGFRGPINHGLLTASMLTDIGGQLAFLATEMRFEFLQPAYFGEKIRCEWMFTDVHGLLAEAEVTFTNAAGRRILVAHIKGRLPDEQQRKMLERL
ncbi:MAG: hypothetical protein KDK23_01550 [Leptospiraceae bacterium]|nr:hypothetical protein [Leptospiraceae bacterium]